jgi:peptidoglycan/LPS O-acetylase OafA/YrhL
MIFGTLNGLRGIAALVIVAFHTTLCDTLHLNNGYLAVDLFFVLSGFVVAHAYEKRLQSGVTLGGFLRIRLIRLYPLYILGVLLSILFLLLSYLSKGQIREEGFASIPYAILMLPTPASDWSQGQLYPLNLPAWSLFFELIVNVVYAATFRYWTPLRIGVVLTIIASIFLYTSPYINPVVSALGGTNWSSLTLGLMRVFYSFPAGVLIYRLYQRGVRISAVPPLILIAAFPLLLMLPSTWGVPFDVLVGFPVLVALATASDAGRGISAVSNTLGAASYAVYAIHDPLHQLIVPVFERLGVTRRLADIVLVACIIPVSLFIDRVYDTPIRARLSNWSIKLKPTRPPAKG